MEEVVAHLVLEYPAHKFKTLIFVRNAVLCNSKSFKQMKSKSGNVRLVFTAVVQLNNNLSEEFFLVHSDQF